MINEFSEQLGIHDRWGHNSIRQHTRPTTHVTDDSRDCLDLHPMRPTMLVWWTLRKCCKKAHEKRHCRSSGTTVYVQLSVFWAADIGNTLTSNITFLLSFPPSLGTFSNVYRSCRPRCSVSVSAQAHWLLEATWSQRRTRRITDSSTISSPLQEGPTTKSGWVWQRGNTMCKNCIPLFINEESTCVNLLGAVPQYLLKRH